MTRYESIMEGAAFYGSYYRSNPEKFVQDYLHIKLRRFQKILIVMMFWCTSFVLIAARGIGKTFISAIYCVTRAILYPGTKICIASGTRGQAINVLEKILFELKPNSPELCSEINEKESKINGTDAKIVFFNTSVIKVVTASDSSRGNRCNVLLLDEFRLITKSIIDTVLRKFLTLRRMPRYDELTDEQRKKEYDKEKNLTMWLSSAFYKDHWSYTKCTDTGKMMIDDSRRQFVCGLPYQLSIEEGLLDPEGVADEMSETDFSEVKFSMEMDALFYGSADGAFFDFATVAKNRHIRYPMLPSETSGLVSGSQLKIVPKQAGEIRILSADIALMSSARTNNDATSIFVNQMLPTKAGRYTCNFIYADAYEGMRTDDQALAIRRLYDEFLCDYIVLDTSGLGIGVYDCLARNMPDPDSGQIFPALSCCNNAEMASRCLDPYAPKVIWAIKASAQFNSDCAYMLREGFSSGRIRLLSTEYDAESSLCDVRGYSSLDQFERVKIQLPYVHTTLLIDELVNLQYDTLDGKIRIRERAGRRKDRYSSLSYNYYVAMQISNQMEKKMASSMSGEPIPFIVKVPNTYGRTVKQKNERPRTNAWF